MKEVILQVKNLKVKFGEEEIISNLSFEVREGEILTILGPNGSGKTTLLRALLGIIPYKGKIEWKKGLKINFLPQHLNKILFCKLPLTVEEFFKLKKVGKASIIKILKKVGINKKILSKNPCELSMGQFQRILVAWTLVDEPDILLLDEPMTGIDIGGLKTIYSLLEKFWKEKNLTILMVTHDLNIVYSYSSKCLCMSKSGICYGSPKSLTPKKLEEIYGSKIKFFKHTHWW